MSSKPEPTGTSWTTPGYTLESTSYTSRQTEMAWTYHWPYDAVWEAVTTAVGLQELELVTADRAVGLAIAKPALSLLNFGRQVAFAFSRKDDATLVRATSLHGMLSLQSRQARLRLLEGVLRTALRMLERDAERAAQAQEAQQQAPPEVPPAGAGAQAPTPSAATGTASTKQATQGAPEPPPVDQNQNPSPGSAATAPPAAPRAPQPHEMDFRHTKWEDLPLERPATRESRRFLQSPRPRAGLGIRRSLLWFLVGTTLAVGIIFLMDALSR